MNADCCIAYLDILGFKYLIDRRTSLATLSEAILRLLDGEEAHACATKNQIEYVIFSDSVLAINEADGHQHQKLANMVRFCSHLLALSIHERLPIRGAISWGTVDWAEKVKIGAPINEAVAWERKQDWAGIMLTGSSMTYMNRHQACRDEVEELLFPLDKDILPLKTDPPSSIKAGVVRPHGGKKSEYAELSRILRELGLESCNLGVQRKLKATAELFDHNAPSE